MTAPGMPAPTMLKKYIARNLLGLVVVFIRCFLREMFKMTLVYGFWETESWRLVPTFCHFAPTC